MKRTLLISLVLVSTTLPTLLFAQSSKAPRQIPLPTSKMLTTPSPGHLGSLNSFPATIALSPDGHYAAILNEGYGIEENGVRQSIGILNLDNNQLADFPDDRLGENAHQSYFLGLTFSADGRHLYASIGSITDATGEKAGDTGNGIAVYDFREGKVSPAGFLKIPPQNVASGKIIGLEVRTTPPGTAIPYPAGITLLAGEQGDRLLIANNVSDNVVMLDAKSGQVTQRFDVSTSRSVPGALPYTVVATRAHDSAYCSLWNGSRLAELDLRHGTVKRWIALLKPDNPSFPGSHPTAMVLSPDEKLLYVALSNVDRVAVVSTQTGKPVQFFDTSAPGQKFPGTYPSALALSTDGKLLFAADASINAVAVFDTTKIGASPSASPQSALGFIPTDWYPSALAVHDHDLIIATAKGTGTGPNNGSAKTQNERHHRDHPYIATLLRGSVARLNIEDTLKDLPNLTAQVEHDNLFRSDPGKFEFRDGKNPIKHVIYILKENRTYDQIFGDLKVGNGDPSLTMYGEDITPNQHKLALQFGVLDNFYDSGEVSGNGHVWSNAAITTDYTEKNWQITYRGEERTYDFIGAIAGDYPMDRDESDVDDPQSGFLWDNLARHNLSYRVYGEFLHAEWCKAGDREPNCKRQHIRQGEALPANVGSPHGALSPWPWPIPVLKHMRPNKPALRDHFDPVFPDFQLDYPDQLRADEFLNEFEGFVQSRREGKAGQLPAFVLLYLPTDHTAGTRPNLPRPAASVADNDLAVGRVVEAVSQSPYWDDTAIFVIEDDAQNGADHVDAHRSIALAISRYSPSRADKPVVDSRFYTTVNMIHSMEELLGLPPMNQNDAYAPVMSPLFAGPGSQPAFSADWRNRENGLIYQMNPERGPGAKQSEKMNFSRPDAVDAEALNAILWRESKGDVPMPPPKHTVLPR